MSVRPIVIARRTVLALAAVLLAGGCSSVRQGADRGQRIVEGPGAKPAKIFATIGTIPGYAIGAPFMVLLLPTLPFESLTYPSSPEGDIPMPILYAPLEVGSGLGALVFASPFILARPSLGGPEDPTEWPPVREPAPAEERPGEIVDAGDRDPSGAP